MHRTLSVLLNRTLGGRHEMFCSRAWRDLPRLAWTIDIAWLALFGEPNHTLRINWQETQK